MSIQLSILVGAGVMIVGTPIGFCGAEHVAWAGHLSVLKRSFVALVGIECFAPA